MKDYADQLIMESRESRNNVNHSAEYTKTIGCRGECYEKKQEKNKEYENSAECHKYWANPRREFAIKEDGMWTTARCLTCGFSAFWAVGDDDALF